MSTEKGGSSTVSTELEEGGEPATGNEIDSTGMKDKKGLNAKLWQAANKGDENEVKYLLDQGASVNATGFMVTRPSAVMLVKADVSRALVSGKSSR